MRYIFPNDALSYFKFMYLVVVGMQVTAMVHIVEYAKAITDVRYLLILKCLYIILM